MAFKIFFIKNLVVVMTVLALCQARVSKNVSVINEEENLASNELIESDKPVGCVCGVFLSGSFKKSSNAQPSENPAIVQELDEEFPCTPVGNKLCTSKCLDIIVKYLPNSPAIICGAIDRDCYKERAHLFIKNCKNDWVNTNLSAGREYCCKDGSPHKCSSSLKNQVILKSN